uniref:Cdc6 C-terminal domain-containing protein n=1 Tax=Acrobeloides nanus TaxID=290746 RepID=A0A914CKE5_9BILA
MDPKAIELCAAKVAASTGDVRTALKVAQQALKQINDDKPNVLKPINRDPSYETPKKNACKEVLSVMKKVYSSPLARAKIPLQPAVLLATFIRLVNNKRMKTINQDELFNAYLKVCKALKIPSLERDELLEALQVLETQSMIGIQGHRITFEVDVPQARAAIGNTELVSSIDSIPL